MKTLNDLFLDELADIYDAEKRLVKALPKMVKAATCTHLKKAILSHLEETKGQIKATPGTEVSGEAYLASRIRIQSFGYSAHSQRGI